jgi:2',3'-cyclic-nucleotide 2'-phosphodiesterase (5'-nucleotidase family)
MVIAQKQVKSLLIGGAAVDDEKMYRLVTNNFIAEGGDGMKALSHAAAMERTGITVRDAMIAYVKSLTAAGKPITAILDGRVVLDV